MKHELRNLLSQRLEIMRFGSVFVVGDPIEPPTIKKAHTELKITATTIID